MSDRSDPPGTSLTAHGVRSGTDKAYWHKYTNFYEAYFRSLGDRLSAPSILEIGVLKGASIRLYLEYFQAPDIVGMDILAPSEEWPRGDNIAYLQVDQSDRADLERAMTELDRTFDLIVDDGGHQPVQQYNTLLACLPYLSEHGYYILEDLHTSMPGHQLNPRSLRERLLGRESATCYHTLLMLNHRRELHAHGVAGEKYSGEETLSSALFSPEEVEQLDKLIGEIRFFKRNDLPLYCWRCGKADFDYTTLRCRCGVPLLDPRDSLTAVITRRG